MFNVREEVEALRDYGIGLRRELHRHPELGLKEFKTTELIKRELTAMGADILDSGLPTGVIAEVRGGKPGKTIAVRADIDALPVKEATGLPFASETEGVCHACGHDMHTACALLTAKVLCAHKDEFSGAVRFLFQPAEEGGQGALLMLEHGALKSPQPDMILGIHTWPDTPAGKIGVKPGPSHASSDTITITVKGKGGHGAHPYRCVDPVAAACFMVGQLQTIVARELPMTEGAVLTFGSIHGGSAANVIPDSVELKGTLRATNPVWRKTMQDSIRRIAEQSCAAMRAEAEVVIEDGMPPLVNVSEIIDLVRTAGKSVLGEDCVMELPACSPGSDDFARYLEFIPGALFRMGTGNDDPATHIGLHNAKNCFDEEGIPVTAAVLVEFMMENLK